MHDIITCTLAANTLQISKPNKQATKEPTKQIYFYREREKEREMGYISESLF
jgi:hypothetical protein